MTTAVGIIDDPGNSLAIVGIHRPQVAFTQYVLHLLITAQVLKSTPAWPHFGAAHNSTRTQTHTPHPAAGN
jgi:hypothetical protein